MATLPSGVLGYIEIPITSAIPTRFKKNDSNTVNSLLVHTYHSGITEPINDLYKDMKQANAQTNEKTNQKTNKQTKKQTSNQMIPSKLFILICLWMLKKFSFVSYNPVKK